MALRWLDRFSGRGPWPVEYIEHIRFTKEGLEYTVDPETGVSYIVKRSLVPGSVYLEKVVELKPPTSSPTYDPTITYDFDFDSLNQEFLAQVRDDDPLPRSQSPFIEVFPIPEYSPPPKGLLDSVIPEFPPRDLLGQVAFHCYNLQNGTNLQFWGLLMRDPKDTGINYGRIGDRDFEFRVRHDEVEEQRCSTMITTLCRWKPQHTPGHLCTTSEVEGNLCAAFDRLSVDDFFKDDLPDWVPDDASDNLQYYEMKESEVEEYKEWLYLYAKLGFFTTCGRSLKELGWAQPFELGKIIVQTREHVEPKKKAMAENAIFYIAFKTWARRDYKAIIRRTMDGTPEHMSLEIKCFKM